MFRRNQKICVFTLTYNQFVCIEHSFKSLYKKAGCEFDHFVFDDFSNKETKNKLKELKKKYKFNLYFNEEHLGTYKSFYYNLDRIPLVYNYYVKIDSNIEILSDNIFNLLIEKFKHSVRISGMSPKVEGTMNLEKSGSFLIFPYEVFSTFERLGTKRFQNTSENWKIDSELYNHAKIFGEFLIVEDLNICHVNQRKNNYFINRQKENIIDNKEAWFMNASKTLYPRFLDRSEYDVIKRSSTNFENFLENCKEYLKSKKLEQIIIKKPEYMKKMYKITSPLNFRTDPNIAHGDSKYFAEIPAWAKNNPRLVIEVEEIPVIEEKVIEKPIKVKIGKQEVKTEKLKELEEKTTEKEEVKQKENKTTKPTKKDKEDLKCDKCNYVTNSSKRLKTHRKKHK